MDQGFFLLFTDDFSGWKTVYFLKHKSETLEQLKILINLLRDETGNFVKVLRTDNGGEFCSQQMQKFLSKKEIRHETTTPHTPQQNGVAGR